VKLWNVFNNELIETLQHTSDVLAVAFRPDGKQVSHPPHAGCTGRKATTVS
jgi:hypothetical protein